jgi:hypothetical protein
VQSAQDGWCGGLANTAMAAAQLVGALAVSLSDAELRESTTQRTTNLRHGETHSRKCGQ